MLRFSIMIGMILFTLNPHSLKANDDDAPHHLNPAKSLRDTLFASGKMGPEGVKLFTPDGIPVARLYHDGFTHNMPVFYLDGEWRKQEELNKKRLEFEATHHELMERLDETSLGKLYFEAPLSTHYALRASAGDESAGDEVGAKLEIGFLALKHRKDKQLLREIFKGIPPDMREKYFNVLLFKNSPPYSPVPSSTNLLIQEAYHALQCLEKELMRLPFNSSKTDFLNILKSLCIESLFEE